MTTDQPDYLTVREVARLLRLSEDTVRDMLNAGRLPGYRLGQRRTGWRISRAELDAWIQARRGPRQDSQDGDT
jgi:excisionase family DNA binding protein